MRFVNVNPTESDVDESKIRGLYNEHQNSCIVCGGTTETETEYAESGSDLSYRDKRLICVSCETMVTEIDDEFVEFYLEDDEIDRILGDTGVRM